MKNPNENVVRRTVVAPLSAGLTIAIAAVFAAAGQLAAGLRRW